MREFFHPSFFCLYVLINRSFDCFDFIHYFASITKRYGKLGNRIVIVNIFQPNNEFTDIINSCLQINQFPL